MVRHKRLLFLIFQQVCFIWGPKKLGEGGSWKISKFDILFKEEGWNKGFGFLTIEERVKVQFNKST